jgi:hypothetical protein
MTDTKEKTKEPPAPEVLRAQSSDVYSDTKTEASAEAKASLRKRHATYRPSHKATFIGIAVVVAILAVNAGVIAFFMQSQKENGIAAAQGAVTLSPAVLDTLGVSRNPIGNSGTELVVGPNSRFNGTVTIGSDVSIGGQLSLNGKFSVSDASLSKLQAGDTKLQQLNVNGDGTMSNLSLRRDLTVVGLTRLQGPVTMSQLLTVNNSVNIAGNLSVGGTLSARSFQASSLTSDSTLTVGGHILTRGAAPGFSPGPALSGADTATSSGNDIAGTVAVNIGAGSSKSGIVGSITFRNQYGNTPHVVVTAVGGGVSDVYVNRSASGFSIGVGSISPGGHAFDYIVMQ